MLGIVLDVQSVKSSQNAHQGHDVAENGAESVNAAKNQRPVEEVNLAEFSAGHGEDARENQDRDEQQVSFLQARGRQGKQEASQDQDQGGMEPEITHRSNLRAS